MPRLGIIVAMLILLGAAPDPGVAGQTADDLSAEALKECQKGRQAEARAVRLAHFKRGQALAERAVTLDDQLPDAHFALFCNLGEQMRIDGEALPSVFPFWRVMAALDRTLALDPHHLGALSSKGTFLVRLPGLLGGDQVKGEQMLRHVIREDPTAVNARLTLAKIDAARGKWVKGFALATEALEIAQAEDREDLVREAEATLSRRCHTDLATISTPGSSPSQRLVPHPLLGRRPYPSVKI